MLRDLLIATLKRSILAGVAFCLAQTPSGLVYMERRNGHTFNGRDTDGRPTAQVAPQVRRPASASPVVAMTPSVADAVRSAFAALLWHEHLVKVA